jgi:hypothetical protein
VAQVVLSKPSPKKNGTKNAWVSVAPLQANAFAAEKPMAATRINTVRVARIFFTPLLGFLL